MRHLNRIANFVLTAAAIFAAVHLAKRWFDRDARVGRTVAPFEVVDANGNPARIPPASGGNHILIFWATWCGPCGVELSRLQSAIDKGEIPKERILAVSLGEDDSVVRRHVGERHYTFPVFTSSRNDAAQAYEVHATPTTFHLGSSGEIVWVAEGIHPFSASKAREHLRPK